MPEPHNSKFRPSKQIGVGGLALGPNEKEYLQQAIESNRLSYGPFSKRFEAAFAKEHDCRFATFCNSGTSALHMAIAALKELEGWDDGDEIVVPATTFIATSNAVLHHNLQPVFVDVDARTYNIDPILIEEKITSRTRALIPVHMMGLPADMDPIIDIAKRHRLRLIEDSCQTMFATYKGRKVGSLGDIGCFSTYIAHFIVAGIGGFATTNNPELATILRSLMNHGRDCIYLSIDDDKDLSEDKLYQVIDRRFSFVRLGYNFRATEMEAAIGLAQLENKDAIIHSRRTNAQFFIEGLSELRDYLQLPYIPPNHEHLFMLFPLVVKKGTKKKLLRFLELNLIETRDLFPLINQPFYVELFGNLEYKYPVSKRLLEQGFYIGCHQYLTADDCKYIVSKIAEFFASS